MVCCLHSGPRRLVPPEKSKIILASSCLSPLMWIRSGSFYFEGACVLTFFFPDLRRMKNIGENVVRIEAEALRALADRIGGPMAAAFQRAVDLMFSCAGRVVVTGMGKSGLIARKIAATLSSTGTPALYLHPVEALHGDLGMVVRGDVVLALSASGETEEILALLATIKRLRVPLIAMTGDEICDGSHPSKGAKGGAVVSVRSGIKTPQFSRKGRSKN